MYTILDSHISNFILISLFITKYLLIEPFGGKNVKYAWFICQFLAFILNIH
jgi:hypothetical protein